MPRNAEQTARSAEVTNFNRPGYCLQWSRERALIDPLYPDATTAWLHTVRQHHDRRAPRGAFVYWTGGGQGYGHIAISLGAGDDPWIRSTDAGGSGIVATHRLSWFITNWSSLDFAGWADNVNGQTVPGVGDWFDMATEAELRAIVREVVVDVLGNRIDNIANETQKAVWDRAMEVTNAEGETKLKKANVLVRETWERLAKHVT